MVAFLTDCGFLLLRDGAGGWTDGDLFYRSLDGVAGEVIADIARDRPDLLGRASIIAVLIG